MKTTGLYKSLLFNIFLFSLFLVNSQELDSTAYSKESNETDSLNYYEKQKLKEEIVQLKTGNNANPFLKSIPIYTGLITVILAIIAAYRTARNNIIERRNEAKQREQQIQSQKEVQFNKIIEKLNSDNKSIQASAGVSLMTFLRPEYEQFHHQVYLILLATLKMSNNAIVNSILTKAFEIAIRLYLDKRKSHGERGLGQNDFELDFTRINLYRADLSNLNLDDIDFAFAKLDNVNFRGSSLRRAKGYKVNLKGAIFSEADLSEARMQFSNCENAKFHKARLVSVKFQNSILRNCQFHQAMMQEINLTNADIAGIDLVQADVNNAYIKNVDMKKGTIKNFKKAANWEKANVDKAVRELVN